MAYAGVPARAVPVRIASYNVYFGIDTGSDRASFPTNDDYAAVLASFQRVQPEIVCFQELANEDQAAWLEMAATLDYPYYAFASAQGGTFAGSARLGIWSKYPILAADEVKETVVDTNAAEMTRWPLHAVIQVPGALNPLHVFSVHNKSGTTTKEDRMRRAFEVYRTVNYIKNLVAAYPLDTEYAIMGDWNDTIEGAIGTSQNTNFPKSYYEDRLPSLPGFNDGSDIPWNTNASWLLPYRYYPSDRLAEAGMAVVEANHTGTNLNWTHWTASTSSQYRLDYILFSDEIMQSAYGAPVAEVYNSEFDGVGVGLPKYGSPPMAGVSSNASDHRMVFADFHLIDAVPGVTPVGLISEVVDHAATTNGNYIEICNTGASALDLDGYSVRVYLNGSTNATSISLSGSLAGGGVWVLAPGTGAFQQAWGVAAQQQAAIIGQLNGNDTVALHKPGGSVSDIYGQIGALAGAWAFTNATAARNVGVSDPANTWLSSQWTITPGTNTATPGWHQALSNAAAYVSSGPALDPSAPRATNDFAITIGITPNLLASNMAASGFYRIQGGAWNEQILTNAGGTAWRTPLISVSKEPGNVLDYYVRYVFQGPGGFQTNYSETKIYTFPVVGSSAANLKPMINEVQADGNGADSNEFVEIIGPAGLDLAGYRLEHRNGATTTTGAVWTFTFPAFVLPDDGLVDFSGNALGFAVVSQNSNYVANTDFLLPGTLLNSGDGLILYDASGTIMDAVVWLGDTFDIGVDDPATVSTNALPGSKHYLHVIGTDPNTDSTPQAPNNILMGTGTWYTAAANPGALNAQQQSGQIIMAPGDADQDGLLDDVDNCPDTYNPTQIDTDGDGQGDACDGDLDGDGIANAADNCPYNPNPSQSDIDGDGVGDECDPDADGDGLLNEDDPEPFSTGIMEIDFEDAALKSTYSDYAPRAIAGRMWVLSNALVVATNDASDHIDETRGAKLRGTTGGFYLQGALTNGIADFEMACARYGNSKAITLTAQYNAGAGWVTLATAETTNSSLRTNAATVNVVGPVDFRIVWTAPKNTYYANLDNIRITSYVPPESGVAECALAAPVSAAFDGSEHPASFTVTPDGIPYTVAYAPTNPVEVGVYHATVTVPDNEYVVGGVFVFSNAVTITQGVAVCEMPATVSTAYDGLPHTNLFTITTGLSWSVVYSPSHPPVDPGAYDATVSVTGDVHYLGGTFVFSNAVVITPATATCSMAEQIIVNYDGAAHTNRFDVTAGLSWSVVYTPLQPPVDVGTYDATVCVTGNAFYVGLTNVYSAAVVIQAAGGGGVAVGDPFIIDFDSNGAPSAVYAAHTNSLNPKEPRDWFINNGYRGSTTSDVRNVTNSIRLRFISVAATSNGVLQSLAPFSNGIHAVAFNYAMYGSDSAGTLALQTSSDSTNWTTHTNVVANGINANFASFSNTISVANSAYLRFLMVGGNAMNRINLDDVVVIPYTLAEAVVTLTNLTHIYDGAAKSPTVTTDPAGLAVSVTYNGTYVVPVTAGTYGVVAFVTAPGYTGQASNTLVISKAAASVALANLDHTYNGTPRPASATTVPEGLAVAFTYNGSTSTPVAAGAYAVTGAIVHANYAGSMTGTLVIAKADALVWLDHLWVAYNGAAQSPSVATDPTGLVVSLTYDGFFGAPTNCGSYEVAGTVVDLNYTGTVSDTFTISKAPASVTLGNLAPTYDGTPQQATVETLPAGLAVDLTYNGSATAPTGAGTYAVTGTVNDANYDGAATGTLVIAKGGAGLYFTELAQTYDGTAKSVAATSTPAGLAVVFSYDGNPWAPTNAGAYAITGTIVDLNYAGLAAATLVVHQAAAAVTLGNLAHTYDGMQKTATATTMPAGLAVTLTYDGEATAPTNAGYYTVTGLVHDANYAGSATGTLAIGKAEAAVYLQALVQTFDGTARHVTATSAPAGLAVVFTYDGNLWAPTNAGSYAVTGAIHESNWEGVAADTFTIQKASQTIANFLPTNGSSFLAIETIGLSAAAASGLPVSFSTNGGPGVISGGTNLGFTGTGSVSVVAAQSGDANWHPAFEITNTYDIAKAQALVYLQGLSQAFDGSPRLVTATTMPAGLTVLITYDGHTDAPTNAGNYAVTGTVSEALYEGSSSGILMVSTGAAAIYLDNLVQVYDGTAKYATATTMPAGLTVEFTYDGQPWAPTNAGSYAVTGTVQDVNWPGTIAGALVIQKASQTIADFLPTNGSSFLAIETIGLSAAAASGLPVSFSTNGGPGIISGGTNLGFTGTGSVSVVAVQSGDANWHPAFEITNTYDIAKAQAMVYLQGLSQAFNGSPRLVTATTMPAGLTVLITYDGHTDAPTNAGNYAVTGTVSEALYEGSSSGILMVSTGAAAIYLDNLVQVYDGTAKYATATTMPAGLTVEFTYDGQPWAPTNAGSYAVTGAIHESNWEGVAADTFTIQKASQTIANFLPTNGSTFLLTETIGLSASAASGLPVSFSTNGGPGIISGGTNLGFTGTGSMSVVAAQSGDANWSSAPEITHTFQIRGRYTLFIVAAYGTAFSAGGVFTNTAETILTNRVNTPLLDGSTTQFVCLGWTMTGNDPGSGTTNSFVMTVTNDAVLTWRWATNYWLDAASGSNGILQTGPSWQLAGFRTQITAVADAYYHLARWSGDAAGTANPLDLLMDQPKTIRAEFAANLATNATPEWWLARHGWTNQFDAAALADTDLDGIPACQEYVANTSPTNGGDYLRVDQVRGTTPALGRSIIVRVAEDREYAMEFTDGRLSQQPLIWMPFMANGIWTNTAPYAATHTFVDDGTTNTSGSIPGTQRLYRVRVDFP